MTATTEPATTAAPTSRSTVRRPEIVVVVATVAALAHAAVVVTAVVPRLGPMGWDPANHSMWGLTIYHDVVRGNWISFAFDTYRQVYWPFLHSWVIAAAMLVLGPTAPAARIVSVAGHAFTTVVLATLAHRAAPRACGLAAAVAAGLWLTTAAYLRRFAADAFTESLAIAVTGAAFLVLARALERPTRGAWAAAGVLTMVTYFTKTDYGLVLGLATACAWLLESRRHPRGDALRLAAAYLLPVALLAGLWFAYPAKIEQTFDALVNRPQGPAILSLDGALYHFRQLAFWSDGPWTFGALVVALALSVATRRPVWLRTIAIYVVLALLLHTLSQTKDSKHVVKVLPWLFLLAGVQSARVWAVIVRFRHAGLLRGGMVAVLLALAVVRLVDVATAVRRDDRGTVEPVLAALVQRIEPGRTHAVIGEFGRMSPHLTNWTLLARGDVSAVRPDPFTKKARYGKERLEAELAGLREQFPLVGVLEHAPAAPPIEVRRPWSRPRPDAPAEPDSILDDLLAAPPPDRVLIVTLERGSPFGPVDPFLHDGRAYLPELAERGAYTCVEWLRFPERGVQLFVFDRKGSGASGRAAASASTQPCPAATNPAERTPPALQDRTVVRQTAGRRPDGVRHRPA